jgi:hypothetical protein
MNKLLPSLALALLAFPCLAAPSPEEIIDGFFGPKGVPNRAASYSGEMKERYSGEPTIGQMFVPGTHYTARRLALSPDDAPVYGVAITTGDKTFDWYAYFASSDGTLKLRAVRSLLSGIPSEALKDLARKPTRNDEEEWFYQNLRIVFLPDVERLVHFRQRPGALDALKAAIDAKDDAAAGERTRTLHFSGWHRNDRGQVEISIGGLINSAVGLLYVPPGERPPPIDETDHIYIEQIDGPWYVYKTT